MVTGERSIWTAALNSKAMTYIGQRSYAVYLIHVLATHVVDKATSTSIFAAHNAAAALGAYAATLGLSLVIAEGLYRFLEGPCIRLGHAWSAALQDGLPTARRVRPKLAVRGGVPAPLPAPATNDGDVRPTAQL